MVKAIKLANSFAATTIGFTGFSSGELGKLVDINLHVASDSIEHVEDIHLVLEHLITKTLREKTREMVMNGASLAVFPKIVVEEDSSVD